MKRARRFVLVAGSAFACFVAPAGAAPVGGGPWSKPVSGPVVRVFDAPDRRFGPGHLGVDFSVTPDTAVRAAGDGVVAFAGRVGSGLHVVVRHPGDIRTSYSFLASAAVVVGQAVERGAVVGTSGGTGPRHEAVVVHFGVRVGASYVDPMLLFDPVDLAAVVHLAAPHGGPAGPPGPVAAGAGSLGERAALVAALRVDARPAVSPPGWWSDAQHPATRESHARTVRNVPVAAPESRPPAGTVTNSRGPLTAVVAATVMAVGGFPLARRRWRGRGL